MSMLAESSTLLRVMDTLDNVPRHWREQSIRARIWHALESSATMPPTAFGRVESWEAIRYLSINVDGVYRPLYSLTTGAASDDPYATGTPPEFGALMAQLNRVAGMA